MEEIKNQNLPIYLDLIEKKRLDNLLQRKKAVYINKYKIKVLVPKYYKPISKLIDFNNV